MENNETVLCPLCRNEKIKIYAVGDCGHPVCHLCSTKMRILCEQTYCSICRQELPRVYYVSEIAEAQATIDPSRFTPIDETGDCGIYYPIKSEWIRRETEKLLRNFCPFCDSEYVTFEILQDHVRRTHRFFYCDLCVEHVNLFPHERKCYSRHDLVQHIRQGDRDDTSFKGHPLCRFCDDHFLDEDQLYKHMRKEHYYCHLCTTENVYYSNFDLLRDHYRATHYLCEIGQCKDVQFTNVFSSELEFRAHQASLHSKSRAEARQLGTIPVEFQSSSVRDRRQQRDTGYRDVPNKTDHNAQGDSYSSRNDRDDNQRETSSATGTNNATASATAAAASAAASVPSIDEFPTLGDRSSGASNFSHQRGAWSNDPIRGIHSEADFPTLNNRSNSGPTANAGQNRGIWRESQQQPLSSTVNHGNVPSKKASQPAKPASDSKASMNIKEDFPALKPAMNSTIPAPVSMFATWNNVKKATKTTSAVRSNQPQMRMNTNRLMHDDEDEEYIRRPMSSLTSSNTPMASSNITLITSSDINGVQTKGKQSKDQSLPKAQDFPALPSTTSKHNQKAARAGVWASDGTNSAAQTATTQQQQQKKKKETSSKKKFMEEVHAMPPPPTLSSSNDFPTMGLSELGRRLITEEEEPTSVVVTKKENPPSSASSSTPTKQNKNPSTDQAKKKPQKTTKTNDSIPSESLPSTTNPSVKPETKKSPPQPEKQHESVPKEAAAVASPPPPPSSLIQAPPGFNGPAALSAPPGFITIGSSESPASPSYIFSSLYTRRKDEFHAKLFELFDGDMNLLIEYDRFCEAFYQKTVTTKDFLKFTKELFKDKLNEYLLDLIVLVPNIEQQNELNTLWKTDVQSAPLQTLNNWTKKTNDEKTIHACRLCQQITFECDIDEHNSHHTEFNTQFPSLPAATVSIGRASGRKK